MKLKDADALIKEIIETYEYEYPTATGAFDKFVTMLIPNIINNAPTIDAVPVKHGYWKYSDISEIARRTWYECTCCGKLMAVDYNYCPNCGAEMDEEVQDGINR